MYDLFISHASEDKEELVQPLAEALQRAGVRVWYDRFVIGWGDSIRKLIDDGLSTSRFGVVVLSTAFFSKNWSCYELDGIVARQMTGQKVLLPIWHKVSHADVLRFSPSLAGVLALNTSIGIPALSEAIIRKVLLPISWEQYKTSLLDGGYPQFSYITCPTCGREVSEHAEAGYDMATYEGECACGWKGYFHVTD